MANEYKLSYTAQEIDEKLGKIIDDEIVEFIDLNKENFWISGYVRSDSSYSPGTFTETSGYKRTDYLPISEYSVDYSDGLCLIGKDEIASIAFYKDDKTYISSLSGSNITSIEVPSEAHYMAFSLETSQENILNLKRTYSRISDTNERIEINKNEILKFNQKIESTEKTIEDLAIALDVEMGTQIYTKDSEGEFWKSGYIKPSGRFSGTHSSYKRTDYLPLSEYTIKKINILGREDNTVLSIAYYTQNKTFISGQSGGRINKISTPANASYIAFTIIVDNPTATNELELERTYLTPPANMEGGGMTKIFRTIGVIGDSLASGEMTYIKDGKNTNVDMYEYSWLQYIARNCGSTGYNFSRGGLSTRTFLSSEKATECYTDASKKCQAYFIALGHNDYNQRNGTADLPPLPIGTISDIHTDEETNKPDDYTQNADSYYGNYATIIQKLLEKFPKAKIFAITMKDDAPWYTYIDYSQAVRNVVKFFNDAGYDNVYLLDMEQYFSNVPDEHKTNGHGNTMGYYQYSLEIQTLVDKIIRENPDEFKYVQFINTEYEEYIPQETTVIDN